MFASVAGGAVSWERAERRQGGRGVDDSTVTEKHGHSLGMRHSHSSHKAVVDHHQQVHWHPQSTPHQQQQQQQQVVVGVARRQQWQS